MANRWPRNLKDFLVREILKPQQQQQQHKGTIRCGRPCCKTCAHIRPGTRFCSTVTKDTFRARVTATCKTSNVIYFIECSKCHKQYVGETENPLHLRINGHRCDYYRRLSDKEVAVHFNTSGHTFDNAMIMIIEQMGVARTAKRKERESYWIHTPRSVSPLGLNLDNWRSQWKWWSITR